MTIPAHGTFEVSLTPQAPEDGAADSALGRMSIDKQFHGDLEATSKGTLARGSLKERQLYATRHPSPH